METHKQTARIEKYQAFLNQFALNSGKKIKITKLVKRFGVMGYAVTLACTLGFLEKIGPSLYKSKYTVFEPIHAKKLIQATTDYNKNIKTGKSPVKTRVGKEQKYISYLKSLGYKIHKPITEYKEV